MSIVKASSPAAVNRERLRSWSTKLVDDVHVTQDHLSLVALAEPLAGRFEGLKDKEGKRIASRLVQLALNALESDDPKKISAMKDWFNWLHDQLGLDDDEEEEPPLQMSVFSVVDRHLDNTKHGSKGPGHGPSDIPKGWTGIDARVIDEGSGNVFKVGANGRLNTSKGAKLFGDIPQLGDIAFLGTVHNTARGAQYDIQGIMENHSGLQMGGSKGAIKAAS